MAQDSTKEFLKISIPIQEITIEEKNLFSIVAKGKSNGIDVGCKLFINNSFQSFLGIKNDDIVQLCDPEEIEIPNGIILWGGETILHNLINLMAKEWGLPICPFVNDLNCDGVLLWGDIGTIKPYKNFQDRPIKIVGASPETLIRSSTPLNWLRFKATGFYESRSQKNGSEETLAQPVPFFINIDLNAMVIEIEEKNVNLREEFINLFCLDESHEQARFNNKDKVMLVLKSFAHEVNCPIDEEALENIDVMSVTKEDAITLVIITTGKLELNTETEERLIEKINNYLIFINSDEFLEEQGEPDSSRVHIEISCVEEPSQEIIELIEYLKPQVEAQNAGLNYVIKGR